MSIAQLKEGVENAIKGQPERRFELIGFDACLMATIEVADAFKDLGRYLAASQEIEPGAGWNWTAFPDHIASNPGTDGTSIGATIADSYGAKMNNNYLEMVDLIDMFDSDLLVSDEATELANATRDAVVKKVSGPYRTWASGLSVMFPSFAVWNPEKQLKTYGDLEFFVPEYRALVNSFSVYARSTSVPDTTFGEASLSSDSKTISAKITSLNPSYEQVYVAINKQWKVENDQKQTVTEDVYLGLQPVWSTSGDTSEFSYTSNSKWFMLNGKLASVIAEPTSEKGEQIVKIPLRIERTGGKECTIYTCLDGMYYLLYNFDTDKLVETIGFVAEANNQVNPAQQLQKDDVVFLKYFVMPDSTQVIGSWKAISNNECTFTVSSSPPAFEKAAIPIGSDYAFFGFDLRWKQFVSTDNQYPMAILFL